MLILRVIRKVLSLSSVFIARDYFKKNCHQKQYILTFDDGPHPEWTPKLLDLLQHYNIKGLFFVVGECAERYPEIVKRIHKDGHIVCNHSYCHKDVIQTSWVEYRDNYQKNERLLRDLLKISSTRPFFYRPPRGWIGLRAIFYFIIQRVPVLMWSSDSSDSSNLSLEKIVKKITALSKKKEILLFHDDSSLCLDILQDCIPVWIEKKILLLKLYESSN